MIHALEKLNNSQIEKYSKIANQHHIDSNKNLGEGFLLTEDYSKVFEKSSRTYIDDLIEPSFILVVYTNEDYEKYFEKIPDFKGITYEDIPHGYAVMKNKDKKGNYKKFMSKFFEAEKKMYGSKGLWVLISKEPFENKKSIESNESIGFRKIGEYITQSNNQLKGKPITWNVYLKKYNQQ
jgi:hypothetical protein